MTELRTWLNRARLFMSKNLVVVGDGERHLVVPRPASSITDWQQKHGGSVKEKTHD